MSAQRAPLRRRRWWLWVGLGIVLAALVVAGVLAWNHRQQARSPEALYQEAQAASGEEAAALYALLSARVPILEEYWRLWAAEARLPAYEAVAALHEVTRYRPDGPAARLAHLTLARYYAGIESPETVSEYQAALAIDDVVEVRLELARYLEEQNAATSAYRQYLLALGTDRPDAFEDARRTAPDALTLARDLLGRHYLTDVLDVLQGASDCPSRCLRAQALRRLGRIAEAEDQEAACEGCQEPTPIAGVGGGTTVSQAPSQDPLALWSETLALEESSKLTETLPLYLQIAEGDSYVADDAAYRAWVLARRFGEPEDEARALALLKDMQLNWLAWRATGELVWRLAPAYPEEAVDALTAQQMTRVAALESLGRADLAYQELRLTALVSETPEVILKMAQELSARGYVVQAWSLAKVYLDQHPYAPREFWALSYPRAYQERVEQAAGQNGLDAALLWAVMRQESAFQPEIVSRADARGLMQIMPATQDEWCLKMGLGCVPGEGFLEGPNIAMGAAHLKAYTDYYGGDIELGVLAYNAGPGSVDQWLADPLIQDRDDLLRLAYFGETREYLGRVMLDRMIYQRLYSGE